MFILPPVAYIATKRFCLSWQRADDELLHHGIESGTIRRLPSGEFIEETVALPSSYAVLLATTDERKELIAHAGHAGAHAALPAKPKGFFKPRGEVAAPDASGAKELEGTVD